MSKAEDTRNYIIEKSAAIFNIKGYGGTSLSDIMKVTGLTKGAIYGNFENKNEVAIEVYKYNILAMKRKFVEAMQPEKTATGKLIALTEFYRINWKSFFEKGGCPIQNASIEADDNAPFLRKHVQQSIKDWVKAISGIIEQGQKDGAYRKTVDAQAYAYSILTTLEGGVMLSKIMNNQQLLFIALDKIVAQIHTELEK
jgi:TetR/AcrR family transcriptional repressor of nem operon